MTVRRTFGALTLAVAVFFGLLAVVFAQSYSGRQAVIDSLRKGCARTSENNAAQVNGIRADLVGNQAVADDPRQPQRTRTARAREVVKQRRVVAVLDSHIDVRFAGRLDDGTDRRLVQASAFTCAAAFPAANPITG